MGISMNPKMSGFRKWAEIHQPEKIDKTCKGRTRTSSRRPMAIKVRRHRTSNRIVHGSSLGRAGSNLNNSSGTIEGLAGAT